MLTAVALFQAIMAGVAAVRPTAFTCVAWPCEVDLETFAAYLSGSTVEECVESQAAQIRHLARAEIGRAHV